MMMTTEQKQHISNRKENILNNNSSVSITQNHKTRLLLHGEDGAFPFLTPYNLRKYFPFDDPLIRNHLTLGISVTDCHIYPYYKEKKLSNRKKNRMINDQEVIEGEGKKNRDGTEKNEIAHKEDSTTNKVSIREKNVLDGENHKQLQPCGYRFADRSYTSCVNQNPYPLVPLGYDTMLVPSFDVVDEVSLYRQLNSNEHRNKKSERHHNANIENQQQKQHDFNPYNCQKQPEVRFSIKAHNTRGVNLATPHGMQALSSDTYASIILANQHRHSFAVCLYDQIIGESHNTNKNTLTSGSGEGKGRIVACASRNLSWINEIRKYVGMKLNSNENKSNEIDDSKLEAMERKRKRRKTTSEMQGTVRILSPLVCQLGKTHHETLLSGVESEQMSEEVDPYGGLAIVGWHTLKTRDERIEILEKCVKAMSSKLRRLSQSTLQERYQSAVICIIKTTSIDMILDAILNGAHAVGTALPTSLARMGYAFTFNCTAWRTNINQSLSLSNPSNHASTSNNNYNDSSQNHHNFSGTTNAGISLLYNPEFARDFTPLTNDCTCMACRNNKYTRAYIHHLLVAKELLGNILLFAHNLQQLLLLFQEANHSMDLDQKELFRSFMNRQFV
mmetsp:Transcript_21692/g.30413  ORF Transcript_21692/g.30413 Transcript_21692/m.30413 type:complete len:616 (-) Transcript_21692:55-1902(-)